MMNETRNETMKFEFVKVTPSSDFYTDYLEVRVNSKIFRFFDVKDTYGNAIEVYDVIDESYDEFDSDATEAILKIVE